MMKTLLFIIALSCASQDARADLFKWLYNDQDALQTHDEFPESDEQKQALLWREATEYMEAWLERFHQGLARPRLTAIADLKSVMSGPPATVRRTCKRRRT